MKHVVNILLLGMVLLGIAMMADTPWGLGVALAPLSAFGVLVSYFWFTKAFGLLLSFGRDRLLPVASCFGCRGSVWTNVLYPRCAVSI